MTTTPRSLELFEPTLWRRAELMAVAFATPEGAPPTLGLVFRDADVAGAIFLGWRHALGEVDEHDLIRVAIIEGELRGRAPGYAVHLSIDPGDAPPPPRGGDVWRRMPQAGSPHLRRFQVAYGQHRRYHLAPATLGGGVAFMTHLAIGKRRLAMRRISDVGLIGDPDAGLWDV